MRWIFHVLKVSMVQYLLMITMNSHCFRVVVFLVRAMQMKYTALLFALQGCQAVHAQWYFSTHSLVLRFPPYPVLYRENKC